MTIIREIFAVCCCCAIAYYLLAAAAGMLFARRAAHPPAAPARPPSVAVLKPLHGADDELFASLETFMQLDYPNKEYVFGVSSEEDPAVAVVNQIKRRHPKARITQTVGSEHATNRKVGKLMRMLVEPPSSEILVMSDADVRAERDYLKLLVSELEAGGKTGMATCVYKGVAAGGSLGARLEANFINTDFAPTAILSYYLEPMRHAFASTVAIRQSTLKAVGGLESVKNSYGDDFALARRVSAAGYQIVLSRSIVTMVAERMTFAEFWQHQLRWAMVDRKIRPISQARMLINGPFWALLLILASGLGWPWLAIAFAAVATRLGMATLIRSRVLRLSFSLRDAVLTPLKDLLMQVVWIRSLMGNTVQWRGRKLRLTPGGEMEDAS